MPAADAIVEAVAGPQQVEQDAMLLDSDAIQTVEAGPIAGQALTSRTCQYDASIP